jgi:hypothetical protein
MSKKTDAFSWGMTRSALDLIFCMKDPVGVSNEINLVLKSGRRFWVSVGQNATFLGQEFSCKRNGQLFFKFYIE